MDTTASGNLSDESKLHKIYVLGNRFLRDICFLKCHQEMDINCKGCRYFARAEHIDFAYQMSFYDYLKSLIKLTVRDRHELAKVYPDREKELSSLREQGET